MIDEKKKTTAKRWRNAWFGAAAAAASMIGGASLAQNGVLDQVSPYGNAIFNVDASFLIWQQQIRAGLDGALEGIEVQFTQGDVGAEVNFRIRLGDAWSNGPVLYEETYIRSTGGPEFYFFDASGAGIELNAGETFVMELQGTDTGVWMNGSYVDPAVGPPLYPEPLYLNEASYSNGGWRLAFETYMIEGGGVSLEVAGSCPGQLTASVSGATPGETVAFIFALDEGSVTIPSGPCAGTELGLDGSARLVGADTADASGNAQLTGNAPAAACGRFLQALDVATCTTSNVVQM